MVVRLLQLRLHDSPFSTETLLLSDKLFPSLAPGEVVAVWSSSTTAPSTAVSSPTTIGANGGGGAAGAAPSSGDRTAALAAGGRSHSSQQLTSARSRWASASGSKLRHQRQSSAQPPASRAADDEQTAETRAGTDDSAASDDQAAFVVPQNALLFKVTEATLRGSINFDISLSTQIAQQFGLTVRTDVFVRRVTAGEAKLDSIELVFKDQYVCRSDMWLLQRELQQRCVYAGETLALGELRVQVKKAMRLAQRGALPPHALVSDTTNTLSGLIHSDTRFVFRSRSARFFIMLQVSNESLEFDLSGFTYLEKAVAFVKSLFERWSQQKVTHAVSIVLFARIFLPGQSNSSSSSSLLFPSSASPAPPSSSSSELFPQQQNERVDSWGRKYEDFYQTVVRDETAADWTALTALLIRKLNKFRRRLALVDDGAALALAQDGNVLEAINLAMDVLEQDHNDKDMTKTGQEIVVVSPASGFFNVARSLSKLTKNRMTANGIGCDMICLAQPPLHVVPLFRYAERADAEPQVEQPPSLIERFSLPSWMFLSFFAAESSHHITALTPASNNSDYQFFASVSDRLFDAWFHRLLATASVAAPALPVQQFVLPNSDGVAPVWPDSSGTDTDDASLGSFTAEEMQRYDSWILDPDCPVQFRRSGGAAARRVAVDIPVCALDAAPWIAGASKSKTARSAPVVDVFAGARQPGQPRYYVRQVVPSSGDRAASTSGKLQLFSALQKPARLSSTRGRWMHVFPEGYNPFQRKRHEMFLSAVSWTSLVEPASLPLTCGYFPSNAALTRSFQEGNHTVLPQHESDQPRLPELLDQLIAQRLEQGYQIVADSTSGSGGDGSAVGPAQRSDRRTRHLAGSGFVPPSPSALAAMRGQRSMEKTIPIYRLSISLSFHALVFDVENQQIVVKQYRPQQRLLSSLSGSSPTLAYSYLIWNGIKKTWSRKKVANRWSEAEQAEAWYNWSMVDQLVCGYDYDLNTISKYWRVRFVLFPTLPLGAATCKTAVQGFNRFMTEISRHSIGKGEEAPVRVFVPPEFRDALAEGDEEIPLHAPPIQTQSGRPRLRPSQTRDIVQQMQDPKFGVTVKSRRSGLRFFRSAFVGSEAVSWMVENVDLTELLGDLPPGDDDDANQRLRSAAQKLGQQLVQLDYIEHVSNRSEEFVDARLYYRFVERDARDEPPAAATVDVDEQTAAKPSASSAAASGNDGELTAKVFNAKINVSGDDPKASPFQWILMNYDSVYSPTWPFSMEIHWLVCTGSQVSKFLGRLQRAARTLKMTFFQVPTNQYIENDPFRCASILLLSDAVHTRKQIETYLQRRLNFVLNLRPSFQFVRAGSDQVEYVHQKGAATLLIDSEYLVINLNYTSRPLWKIGRKIRSDLVHFWTSADAPLDTDNAAELTSPVKLPLVTSPVKLQHELRQTSPLRRQLSSGDVQPPTSPVRRQLSSGDVQPPTSPVRRQQSSGDVQPPPPSPQQPGKQHIDMTAVFQHSSDAEQTVVQPTPVRPRSEIRQNQSIDERRLVTVLYYLTLKRVPL